MTRLIWTRVNVVVIFRQQVDIVEEIAFMIAPPARLCEADVQQHAAVEPARMRLNHQQYRKNKGDYIIIRDLNIAVARYRQAQLGCCFQSR